MVTIRSMPISSSPNLDSIATAAGVSAMTVSRVLRNAPNVSAGTRERVLAAASAMNYQPDPQLARMMHLVRRQKASGQRAVIAVIREDIPSDSVRSAPYQFVPIEDIRHRAQQHGYQVEEFWLGRDKLTPTRLQKILHARGIEGVIVSPQSTALPCRELDYKPFAAVTFGYAMREPALHLCCTNLNLGIQMTAAELDRRGYQRIGVAITRWIDLRAQNGYSGGMFFFHHDLPPERRVPTLLMPHDQVSENFATFSEWIKQHRPDVIISFETQVPDWLKQLGLRVPEDIGLVVHDWTPRMKTYAGIHHRRDQIAVAAVDLIATQLLHHEHGIPEVPHQILIPPNWVDGPSIRRM
ncbi:MAG: LacI family DNA-binding transcriptional regulator [Gloeobacteraceae cyanobacterium ES-bin-144]|nr:LacI family DNA-binding transcriptional regulator [Verrucomicrobiales bacterium]